MWLAFALVFLVVRAELQFDVFSDDACADNLLTQTYAEDACVTFTGSGDATNATEFASCVQTTPPFAFLTCLFKGTAQEHTTFERDVINGDFYINYGFAPCGEGTIQRYMVNYCTSLGVGSVRLTDTLRGETPPPAAASASAPTLWL